jgi:anti-sigma factor RsiW
MNMSEHARAQLSAYLDGALGEPERLAVEGHLGTCADCRARLAELRATASLIRSLPELRPSRRLVPRVAAPPIWLAPLRTLTTLASGVSVFLFLATALLANIGGLTSGSGTTAAAPAVAPAASAAPTVPSERGAAIPAATTPASLSAADAAKGATTATPPGAAFSVSQAPAAGGAPADTTRDQRSVRSDRTAAPPLTSPWLWLGLAILSGLIALGLQRRLRSG